MMEKAAALESGRPYVRDDLQIKNQSPDCVTHKDFLSLSQLLAHLGGEEEVRNVIATLFFHLFSLKRY